MGPMAARWRVRVRPAARFVELGGPLAICGMVAAECTGSINLQGGKWSPVRKPILSWSLLTFCALGLTGCAAKPTLDGLRAGLPCYDRASQPQTALVDAHLHFRPFGGPAIPFAEVVDYLERNGVLFANVMGIGQMLPVSSTCTYYLDCPATLVAPTLKNDFAQRRQLPHHPPARGASHAGHDLPGLGAARRRAGRHPAA